MALAVSNRDGGKTSERGLYDMFGSMLTGEVISGFRIRQSDPLGMSVRVGGEGRDSAMVRDGLKSYSVFTDDGAAVDIPVDAAHASLARIDTVVLYVDLEESVIKDPVDNANGVVKAKAVAGTPNAVPAAPDNTAIQASIGAGNPFIKLANVAVAANAVNILTGNITDTRTIVGYAPSLMNRMYPIGSIYVNATDSTNPATLLGFGTWAAFGAGRVPVGFNASDSDFNAAQKTGGSKTHTLTTAQIPSHSHGNGTLTTSSAGAHSHTVNESNGVNGGTWRLATHQSSGTNSSFSTNSAGAHTHNVTGTTANAGSGNSHPIMQPYITVYMWRRTA